MFFIPILSAIPFLFCSLLLCSLFSLSSFSGRYHRPPSLRPPFVLFIASFFFYRTIVSSALFYSLPFPLCTFRASLREPIVPIAALLCPLRRDLIPTKTPPKSPFLPKNLIILTFPSPKICIYQKKCVPLHPISGCPLIH